MRGVIRKSLGVCAGLLLLAPASALAGTAIVEDGIPRYDAAVGEVNNVTVSEELLGAGKKLIVFSDVVPVNVGPGCGDRPGNAAECLVDETTTLARAQLGNKNDRIQPLDPNIGVGFSVEGAPGNDVLIGTQNRDVLDGEGDADTLRGRSGNDALVGANGDDDLRGDAGLDEMFGGAGNDVLNGDDNVGGDSIDCGEDLGDDDFALFNGDDPNDPNDVGDLLAHCERTQEG